jgi:Tol biopolymer transport system component
MSPEQARGKPIDKRSDIWSFGVMLYEMLTGTQMYRGETVTDILGAIVHSSPDVDALPRDVPPALRKLVERCLTPDVQDRLRDIGEARYALHHLDAIEAAQVPEHSTTGRRVWMIACLVLLVVAVGLSALLWRSPRAVAPVIQASIALPEGHVLLTTGPRGGSMRVSPDGRSVAFVAQEEGRRRIWVRALDERDGHPVQGTEGGHRPFWSPDGRSLGFFSDGNLRRVSVSGGAPLTIAPAADGRGAVWLSSGTIVFAPTPGSALFAVAAGGGQPRQLTDSSRYSHREPRSLPDDRHFLFLENRGGGQWYMSVGSIDGGVPIEVGATSGGAEYANGRLLFLQGRTLVAQPFDTASFQLTGEPTPIAEDIVRDSNYGIGVFSGSEAGVLAYQTGGGAGAQLQWLDREGNPVGVLGDRGAYSQVSLSRDGKTIAALIDELDGKSDLWLIDVAGGARQRFTFTPDNVAMRRSEPVWTPDGSRIVFTIEFDGRGNMYSKRTDGSGDEELMLEIPDIDVWPYDVSPDGKWVLYGREDQNSNEDLWVLPLSGEGEPRSLFETPYDEWPGRFSPDGRWVAFDSDETVRREIYVIPFEGRSGKWQVSREGGRFARWSDDGSELFYVDLEGGVMAVSVDPTGDTFVAGEPHRLFQANLASGSFGEYDVDTRGVRFLVLEQTTQDAPISLYMNWEAALEIR